MVLIWWVVDARKWFKGPKVNLEHLMHGRDDQAADIAGNSGNVLEGKNDDRSSDSDDGLHQAPIGDVKPGTDVKL